jgi:hypothetical protein
MRQHLALSHTQNTIDLIESHLNCDIFRLFSFILFLTVCVREWTCYSFFFFLSLAPDEEWNNAEQYAQGSLGRVDSALSHEL